MFRREAAQVATIRQVSDHLRRSTMRTLRVAFLSSMALEMLASLSVALIAVSIGVRLVDGSLTLTVGLTVLLLAPEIYLPWRRVGAAYHASVEGVTAVGRALDVIESTTTAPAGETPTTTPGGDTATGATRAAPNLRRAAVTLDRVRVEYPGRPIAAFDDFSLTIEPGETVAVVGPSGCGKSTLLAVLLRFVEPAGGRVLVDRHDLSELDVDAWRRQLAWVPQRPRLFAASVADNIRLGAPAASDEAVAAAARAAAADFVDALPDGFDTRVGEGGVGLSVGQAQRLAIARAFLRDAPLLLLDEPTTGLDADTERAVSDALVDLMRGRTVVLTSHRPALFTRADRVVRLPDPIQRIESVA
jgi:ABC-type transport system involved in cytochrome bd biosynthesis fused ATPase/permease subunit